MHHHPLGTSGPIVSAVGLGCNNFGGRIGLEATRKVVHRALDLGITLFDTADTYGNKGGSEELLGAVLGARRKEIVLATKFGMAMDDGGAMQGASRAYIVSAVEASLRRLKTEWIDLYQVHKPDPATPIEETLRALDDLVRQGKVRHIGCSNFSAAQVDEAQATAKAQGLAAFVSCQDELSLLARDAERNLIPTIEAQGMGLLPYFPLAGGMLTGKYKHDAPAPEGARLGNTPHLAGRYMTPANWRIVEALEAYASGRGHTLLQLAFAWLAAHGAVASVIAGATKPEQVEQNVAALAWKLSAAEKAEIDALAQAR